MGSMFSRPAERLAEDAAAYIDLKVDELKLRTAKGLSVTLNRLIISILFLTLGSIVLMALAFGGVLLLGDIIGSYAAGGRVSGCADGGLCRAVPAADGALVLCPQQAVPQWVCKIIRRTFLRK